VCLFNKQFLNNVEHYYYYTSSYYYWYSPVITYYYYEIFLIYIYILIHILYTHHYTLFLLIYRDIPRRIPWSPAQLPFNDWAPLGHQRRCSFEGFGTHHLVQPPGDRCQVNPGARYKCQVLGDTSCAVKLWHMLKGWGEKFSTNLHFYLIKIQLKIPT
jgi:hypothetical protein